MMRKLLGLLPIVLALLLASGADAAEPFGEIDFLAETIHLKAPSERVHGIVFPENRELWFAGESIERGGDVAIAGSIGPLADADHPVRTEPAALRLSPRGPLDGIALGAEGDFWMTSSAANEILRVTPGGSVTVFLLRVDRPGRAALAGPTEIVPGPHGAFWFIAERGDGIGRIDPAGRISAYPLASGASPRGITFGADGRAWFTEAGAGKIGALTPRGKMTEYRLPDPIVQPSGIAAAPGGAIWFTESNSPHIGKVTPSGHVAEFEAEAAGPIVFGPKGDLWFGSRNGIGSISQRGVLGSTFCFDSCRADVETLTHGGPFGELWYAEHPVVHARHGHRPSAEARTGSIGEFWPPDPTVVISRHGQLDEQGEIRIPISCGGTAEDRCQGASRLRIDGRFAGLAGFAQQVGRTRDLIIRPLRWARRLLENHRRVETKLFLTVRFELRQEATVVLRRPSDRPHDGDRG